MLRERAGGASKFFPRCTLHVSAKSTTTPKAKKNSSSSKKSDGGDLSKLTCAKLRQMLKAQGLKQKGVKADLIARLQNA